MDGIVLLAKQPGLTSFSSLFNVKKALNTSKVGHTGTLDSFAQGLLVVCTGRLTRLAGNITEFDKEYKAVISFGNETDTLEYTGNTIKESALPTEQALISAVESFVGPQQQVPPQFSALHVNGKRASDIARKGGQISLPPRPIVVYKAEITELEKNTQGLVQACMITFRVSKGTYIRSLARDIANKCGSSGHLIGLYRTRVGNFCIEDAAGYSLLSDFTISGCKEAVENWKKADKVVEKDDDKATENNDDKVTEKANVKKNNQEQNLLIQKEIPAKIKAFDEETARLCGFYPLHLVDEAVETAFRNGKPILKSWFAEYIDGIEKDLFAVFSRNLDFCGLIEKKDKKHFSYRFVLAFSR